MQTKLFKQFLPGKQTNIIQIAGLVLGIVTCIFVTQYVFFEYSFDKFNKEYNQIYRTQGTEGMLLSQLAKEQISYIENAARLHPCYRGVTVLSGDKSFYEGKAYFADGSLFDILTFSVDKGNAKALNNRNQMVISEKYANKYFGNENPVGKTLLVNGAYESNITYTVAAVFKDIPQNSHLQFDILFSIENILANRMYTEDGPWRWKNFFIYFKTITPVSKEQFEEELTTLAINNGMPKRMDSKTSCPVCQLTDIHLNGQVNYMDNNKNARDINIRIFIALIIMAIAWLNFINIGIGSALKNKLDIHVKKVLGAAGSDIWFELFKQSLLLNIVAFMVSVFVFVFLNIMLQKAGILKPIDFPLSRHFVFWISLFCLQTIGAFLISVSIYGLLNREKLLALQTDRPLGTKESRSPWTILFVLQFGASIVLICFAFFSAKQVKGLMKIDKGFQTNHILAIHSANYSQNGDVTNARSIFENEVQKIPGVTTATSASYIPGSTISSCMPTRLAWKNEDADIQCRMNFVGYDYTSLFEHKLIAGRNFSREFPSDKQAIIINETLAKAYGFKTAQDAIDKEIFWESKNENRHVIGVMEDFHQQSADIPVEPTMFQLWDHARGYCLLKINSVNPPATINAVKNLWEKVHQGNAFDYLWIDKQYQTQFEKWVQYVLLVKALALIAILIACIGLYGISTLLLEKRTKEIGIRKVNGARVAEVLAMLNKEFVKWVVIAFIIASPIAWYVMHQWSQNFAYKTELSWWVFAAAGVIALIVALFTVSWQSWRVATRNPVEALRYE